VLTVHSDIDYIHSPVWNAMHKFVLIFLLPWTILAYMCLLISARTTF